jgi:hypothetical protein
MSYNIIINSFSDNFRKVDFKTNSLNTEKVKVFVKNNYFNCIEYETTLEIAPDCNYWISTNWYSNSKNRTLEFRDYYTETLVGLVALEGLFDYRKEDTNFYLKNSFINSTKQEKETLLFIFAEIINNKVYHNDFVNVEENDDEVPFYPISDLRINDANGNPTFPLATPLAIRGVVYSPNLRSAGLLSYLGSSNGK